MRERARLAARLATGATAAVTTSRLSSTHADIGGHLRGSSGLLSLDAIGLGRHLDGVAWLLVDGRHVEVLMV